jgi:hypothetical protein
LERAESLPGQRWRGPFLPFTNRRSFISRMLCTNGLPRVYCRRIGPQTKALHHFSANCSS